MTLLYCKCSGIPPKMFLCQIFIWSCYFQCQPTGILSFLSFLFSSVFFCFCFFFYIIFFLSPEQCPLLYRTDLLGDFIKNGRFDFLSCYHDIVFYFLRLLVTIRANFLQAQWQPNNCSLLVRHIPFRDAYLQSSQNRNCTETKLRDRLLIHQHTEKENVQSVSS